MRGATVGFGLSLSVILASVVLDGCGGSGAKAVGTEGGACYGNGSCNTGLECLSHLCVKPTGDAAAGSGGSVAGTTGGSAGTGGATAGTGGATAGTGGATAGTGGATAGTGGSAGADGSAAGSGGGTGGATDAAAGATGADGASAETSDASSGDAEAGAVCDVAGFSSGKPACDACLSLNCCDQISQCGSDAPCTSCLEGTTDPQSDTCRFDAMFASVNACRQAHCSVCN